MPDIKRDVVLETDASTVALGVFLKKKFNDTKLEHSVAFFSRAFTKTELNYCAYKLEMYSVVRTVKNLRVFLLGR